MGQAGRRRGGKADTVQVVRAREEQCWMLRAKGWTQTRIAEHLQLDQSTVSKALARVGERRLAQLPEQVDQYRVEQNDRLEHLLDEAVQAWERSKTRPRKKKAKDCVEGEPAPEAEKELREGNPRFLAEARAYLADLRKLWGLDAPQKHLVGATSMSEMPQDQHDAIARQLGLLPAQIELLPAPEVQPPIEVIVQPEPSPAIRSPHDPPAPVLGADDLAKMLDAIATTLPKEV